MEHILISDCCSEEMNAWESHCPSCRDGCGTKKLNEDGSEE